MASSSQYDPEYPSDTPFKPEYKAFITQFYQISDMPDGHETYVRQFAPSATIQMGPKTAAGKDDILTLRTAMWEKVKARSHRPERVYPFGRDADEIMLCGTVEYEFKEGGKKSRVDWTGRGRLTTYEGNVVWAEYAVYLGIEKQLQ